MAIQLLERGSSIYRVRRADVLFDALTSLCPPLSWLMLEGVTPEPFDRAALGPFEIDPPDELAPGIAWPRSVMRWYRVTPESLGVLAEWSRAHGDDPGFCHLMGGAGTRALLMGYDAFTDPLLLDESLPAVRVEEFAVRLGAHARPWRAG